MYLKPFFLVATIFFNVACGQKGPLLLTQPASPGEDKIRVSHPAIDEKNPQATDKTRQDSSEHDKSQGANHDA